MNRSSSSPSWTSAGRAPCRGAEPSTRTVLSACRRRRRRRRPGRRGRDAPCARRSAAAAARPCRRRSAPGRPSTCRRRRVVARQRRREAGSSPDARVDGGAGVAVEPRRSRGRTPASADPARRLVGDAPPSASASRRSAEQRADHALGLVVVALAEVRVADVAAAVDQVLRRPVLVRVGVPRAVVVVERDRVADAEAAHRRADVADVVLEGELGRVHADDHEPVLAVGARTRPRGAAACAGS